jgi:uncharacterized protein
MNSKIYMKKTNKPRQKMKRTIKYWYWRLLRIRGTPEQLARGLAAGVFTGLFPIFGLQIATGILLAIIVRGNKILAAAGTWISNPFTSIPLYIVNYQIGRWLLRYPPQSFNPDDFDSWEKVSQLGKESLIAVFAGSCFMGLICAIPTYFLTVWLVKRVRQKRRF